MDYTVRSEYMAQFRGVVEKVFVDGRWVGIVYLNPQPGAEVEGDEWVALTRRADIVANKDAGVLTVVQYADQHPDWEMR